MKTQVNKNERIEIRLSSYDKKVFQKAQKLCGDKSFSSFIVRIVKEQAEEIVAKNDRILASEKDRNLFFEAVFNETLEPTEKLIEATKRYASQMGKK